MRTTKPGFNVLITTYEILLKDKAVLQRFDWEFFVVRLSLARSAALS